MKTDIQKLQGWAGALFGMVMMLMAFNATSGG